MVDRRRRRRKSFDALSLEARVTLEFLGVRRPKGREGLLEFLLVGCGAVLENKFRGGVKVRSRAPLVLGRPSDCGNSCGGESPVGDVR